MVYSQSRSKFVMVTVFQLAYSRIDVQKSQWNRELIRAKEREYSWCQVVRARMQRVRTIDSPSKRSLFSHVSQSRSRGADHIAKRGHRGPQRAPLGVPLLCSGSLLVFGVATFPPV